MGKITNVNQLKLILGELIVVVLFVKFLEIVLLNSKELALENLILPVGIVLLALGLKLLDLKH